MSERQFEPSESVCLKDNEPSAIIDTHTSSDDPSIEQDAPVLSANGDDDDDDDDQSSHQDPDDLSPGSDLTLESYHVADDELDEDSQEQRQPDVDVVHVMGAAAYQKRLGLDAIVPSAEFKASWRDLWFNTNVSGLLNDDLEFTLAAIEEEAHRLLAALKHVRQSAVQHSEPLRRAIILVAYDLGALVVKKAISIVALDRQKWPGIFSSIARVVFSGCFQRAKNDTEMATKMFYFLDGLKNDTVWSEHLNLTTAQNLALATTNGNGLLLESKITFRCRLFSLYAGTPGKRINPIFGSYMATLGIPTELAMPEEEGDTDETAFPRLAGNICLAIEGCAPDRSTSAFDHVLMSLVPPHIQMGATLDPAEGASGILSSEQFENWSRRQGTQVLYIDGPDHRTNARAAEIVCLEWIRKTQAAQCYDSRVCAFSFSAGDPLRNNVGSMLTSSFLQWPCIVDYAMGPDHLYYGLMMDQYRLYHSWSTKDLLTMLPLSLEFLSMSSPMLLLQLDECKEHDRGALLDELSKISGRNEDPVKIVITSRKHGVLAEELRARKNLQVQKYTLGPTESLDDENEYIQQRITQLCPKHHGEVRIRRCLERLRRQLMGRDALETSLHLIQLYTRWPEEVCSDNLSTFCSFLEDISPSTTADALVTKILQSVPDQEGLRWLLGWCLYGQRPMYKPELSTMLFYCRRRSALDNAHAPTDGEIRSCLTEIKSQLGGFADLHGDQVRIHEELRDTLDQYKNQTWGEARWSPQQSTAEFLLDYLATSQTQERLEALFDQYQSLTKSCGDEITAPLAPDGRDAIFYAVQALPHHLSYIEIPESVRRDMQDAHGRFAPWAKVYWAMSNSITRAADGPLESAWVTLVASPEAGGLNMVKLPSLGGVEDGAKSQVATMGMFVQAVMEDKEDLALHLGDELTSGGTCQGINWPASVLWRATWLNMHRLVQFLIDNGVQADDQSSHFFPSPLYLASRLGHSRIVEMLLAHGADHKARGPRTDIDSPLVNACTYGHVDVIRMLLEKDPSQLNVPQLDRPLYSAALWGAWAAVEELLKRGADPNLPRSIMPSETQGDTDWTPLITACEDGLVKTVEILLRYGADPNVTGPRDCDTSLWFAAIGGESVECVRLLLSHQADPNHELLQPPLLNEIMSRGQITDPVKLAILDLLIENDPPVLLERAADEGETPLMTAARSGDLTSLRWLLKQGVQVNKVDARGRHALFHAVECGRTAVIHEFLNHAERSQLDVIDRTTKKTLLEAALERDTSLFELFLENGADPNLENPRRTTVLSVAVREQAIDMVKLLVQPERKVNIHQRDENGWSPILDATGFRPNAEIARVLMEAGASLSDKTSRGSYPMHLAAQDCRADILRVLLEFREPDDLERRNVYEETPLLRTACARGLSTLDCVRLLVRAGADVNAQDMNGLSVLMRSADAGAGDAATQDFLLGLPGVDLDARSRKGETALIVACIRGDAALVGKLLRRGVNVDATALIFASNALCAACMPRFFLGRGADDEGGQTFETAERIVRDLLRHGADVSASAGLVVFNALCAASLSANPAIINMLLDRSASVHGADPLGRLPIHFSAVNGVRNFEVVALAHGEDIMACDHFGKNALHWAAQFGHAETVRAILGRLPPRDRSGLINAGDVDGWTPLAWAARPTPRSSYRFWIMSEPQDYAATVRCLVDGGADAGVRFRIGKGDDMETLTPVQMARRCAVDDDVLRLLTPPARTEPEGFVQERRYKYWTTMCSMCLSAIFGIIYACQTCPDYVVCKKCYASVEPIHGQIASEMIEGPHSFQVRGLPEYEEEPSSSPPSGPGSPVGASLVDVGGTQAAEEYSPELDDATVQGEDDIETLEFPSLEHLQSGDLGILPIDDSFS